MKLSTLFLGLLPAALAIPIEGAEGTTVLGKRQTAITDYILYSISLPSFEVRFKNKNPSNLIWTTDGCSNSPDNPFGFPFVPACHRHDFGYRNYKSQARFTSDNRLKIDNNFKDDLIYQCTSLNAVLEPICQALANVYWAAVRAFGGSGVTSRDETEEDLIRQYKEALAVYNKLVAAAQAEGILPTLE